MSDATLRIGSKGPEVKRWQAVIGVVADGLFGRLTHAATLAWQHAHKLPHDGEVGADDWHEAEHPPPRPQALTQDERAELFGAFEWKPAKGGAIIITDGWAERNIVTVEVPELVIVPGVEVVRNGQPTGQLEAAGPPDGRVQLHELAVVPFVRLWKSWAELGLDAGIITWDGLWAPRCIRGRPGRLSAHAWGTAFDINARWNWIKQRPAAWGERGSVRELVAVAEALGWVWGGHWARPDGMHFSLGAEGICAGEAEELEIEPCPDTAPQGAIEAPPIEDAPKCETGASSEPLEWWRAVSPPKSGR